MTGQYWGADAPNVGAYKEHEVAEVFKAAGFKSLFFMLADKRRVMGGDTLTVPAWEHLAYPSGGTALQESTYIPLSKLTVTAKTIAMAEKGRAVMITGKTARRSPFDILQAHKEAVAELMKRELEIVVSTALKQTPLKAVLDGAASLTLTSNGTPGGAATHNPTFYHIQRLSMEMSDTYRIPKDRRYGAYVGVFRGAGIFSLQRDSEYRDFNQGRGLESISSQIVGKIADVVLMDHDDDEVLVKTLGSNDTSEGLIMGDKACTFGFLEQIGLHYDFSKTKANDFGRFKYIAWLGDYGAGLNSDSANAGLVRAIHVSSNA